MSIETEQALDGLPERLRKIADGIENQSHEAELAGLRIIASIRSDYTPSATDTLFRTISAILRTEPPLSREFREHVAQMIETLEPFAIYGGVIRGQRIRGDKKMLELWGHSVTVKDFWDAWDATKAVGKE